VLVVNLYHYIIYVSFFLFVGPECDRVVEAIFRVRVIVFLIILNSKSPFFLFLLEYFLLGVNCLMQIETSGEPTVNDDKDWSHDKE
jgi:hypothetical protein